MEETANGGDCEPVSRRLPGDDDGTDPAPRANSPEAAHYPQNAAVHELEHRAKHAGIAEGTKLLSGKLASTLEKGVSSHAKQIGETVGERVVAQHGLKSVQENVGEQVRRQLARQAEERIAERAGERMAERGVEAATERASEGVAERLMVRAGILEERIAERAGERMAERGVEAATERASEEAAERLMVRAGISSSKIATAAERTGVRMLLRRIGRGVLIALPLLGAAFALYQLRLDLERALHERRRKRGLGSMLFASAAISDATDALCHFAMAYSFFLGMHHDVLNLLEATSVACAMLSTLSAVGGEVCCHCSAQQVQAQPRLQDKDSPTN